MSKTNYQTIDEFISDQSEDVREPLAAIRRTIAGAVPEASETINYQIPTFQLHGKNLAHFAASKNHIGFYPTPEAVAAFESELAGYEHAKGSVKFPLDKPMPLELVADMVRYKAGEIKEK